MRCKSFLKAIVEGSLVFFVSSIVQLQARKTIRIERWWQSEKYIVRGERATRENEGGVRMVAWATLKRTNTRGLPLERYRRRSRVSGWLSAKLPQKDLNVRSVTKYDFLYMAGESTLPAGVSRKISCTEASSPPPS